MKTSTSCLALVAALSLAVPVRAASLPSAAGTPAAEAVASSASPAASDLAIPYTRFTLGNGLRVVVHEDHTTPFVHVGVWYHVGSRDEPHGQTGFAHLFEHLLFNGSEHHNTDWFGAIEQMGALEINGTTWLDRTNFFETVPTAGLDRTLWLESDRMGHSLAAFDQAKLDEQRAVVKNEKRQGDNQPFGLVDYLLDENVFPPDHPYNHSVIGSMADLDAASVEDVHGWFKKWYAPNNAVVVLVGDIDPATARQKMELYFGDIPGGPEPTRFEANVPVRLNESEQVQYDNVPQSAFYRAWPAPALGDPQAVYLSLGVAALGEGKTSRLYDRLVVRDKLATDVYLQTMTAEVAGMVTLRVSPRSPDDIPRIRTVVQEELDRFMAEGPSRDEVRRKATAQEAAMVQNRAFLIGRAGLLAEGELYRGNPNAGVEDIELALAATPAQVRDATRLYLSRGSHAVTVLPRASLAVTATGADRSVMPPVGPARDLVMPGLETATLSNGLRVDVVTNRGAPTVAVNLLMNVGVAADPEGKEGLNAFAFDMLDEGAGGLSSADIARRAEADGAMLMVGGSRDWGSVASLTLKRTLKPSLELLADLVTQADFPQADIDRIRDERLQAMKDAEKYPTALADRVLMRQIFGEGHPYGEPLAGNPQSLAAITRADLLTFRNAWIRPENGRLLVVGDVTLAEIRPELERTFGRWRPVGPAGVARDRPVAPARTTPRILLVDRPGAEQSVITGAFTTPILPDEEAFVARSANTVLGGYFSSRINMNIREDKGWAYGANTSLRRLQTQGYWQAGTSVQTDKTAPALAELVREVTEIGSSRPITQAELTPVINGEVGSLPGSYQTAWETMQQLAQNIQEGRPYDYAATLRQRYEALTPEAVSSEAAALFKPSTLTWVIVGDMSKVEAGIRALGLGEVVRVEASAP
ncbi:hypothetical protein KOAAANKH_00805 [Brevundimonas sp. NIBR10]|uniref:M16 family metallopeptidase n=1 Tax=Brevundimonas sp. NIBR10 TaxID=3015997 RepID=UPI0022F1B0E3|nr:pitrilysin family protein [Brevundimonas sp. NIBR10]WGM45940.1 hypothetical protein KOAAANKH_00805 [Brevundimonas sp. NIBR10]